MKGIVLYSSKTGNTEKMAKSIYDAIKDLGDISLEKINGQMNLEGYDFALIGSWIDKGTLEKSTLTLVHKVKGKKIGLFGTLGAQPESKHGQDVYHTLESLLEEESLGVYLCPGLVDPKLKENLKRIPEHVLPKHIVDQMMEASITSRYATDEELEKAGKYFKEKLRG
ncbi:MAG: flavodoxin family protein [Tissierellia bacterium]|nr:flavodoxin family protein [Tissierellia bacterium]